MSPPPEATVSSAATEDDRDLLRTAVAEAGRGGKRFRPALLVRTHALLTGAETPPEAVAQVAEAVELLHTAFVVHDDVIDGDQTRRGRPSVPGGFAGRARAAGAGDPGATTYALAGGVLVGDLALAGALRLVATAPTDPAVVRRLLGLLDDVLLTSAAGELADVRLAALPGEPSLEEVLRTAERKTAAYSFQLPMQAGAVLAGAGEPVVAGLGEVGRLLGLAYQLHDDLCGVFGDPASTGKSALGDLREGKRTALVVHARGTTAWPEVRRHLGDPDLTPAQAARARAALEACGSRAFVAGLIGDHLSAASARATELGVPGLVDRLADQMGLGAGAARAVEGAA